MGCPDYIHAECPTCKEPVKFQSKAGACRCADYTPDSVPMEIASDLNGEIKRCEKCGATVKIFIPDTVPTRIAMSVKLGTEGDWD